MAQVLDLEAYRQKKAAKAQAELDALPPLAPIQPTDWGAWTTSVVTWTAIDNPPQGAA